jgi:hypothetical protein
MSEDAYVDQRLAEANKYLCYLNYSLQHGWLDQYARYKSGSLEFPESLALVHPHHYRNLESSDKIRTNRSFERGPSVSSRNCESNRIWGYKCPIDITEHKKIEADHLFPYSLGGPSTGENIIFLCKMHNLCKGSDFHFFPWESGPPAWLSSTINRIYRVAF